MSAPSPEAPFDPADVQRAGLAEDLRALRKARGLTLAELGARAGRSVGWLSQVERGLTAPGISDLRRLAAALDAPISLFFGPGDAPKEERGFVVRAGAGRALGADEDGLVERLLSPDLSGSFEMVHSVFAPGASLDEPVTRPTEEAGLILSGALILWIGPRAHHLNPGDAFRIRGEPYRWRNPGKEPAKALWIISPPVY